MSEPLNGFTRKFSQENSAENFFLVTHSYREPVKGWMGNRYGHIGRDIAVNSGLIRVIRGNQNDEVNDFIPVDYFVNFLICAAFKTFSKRKNSATK